MIKKHKKWNLIRGFLFIVLANSSALLAGSPAEIPLLEASIQLDGELDESAWSQALPIDLKFEISPGENVKPRMKTQAFIFEDGSNLYVAFRAFDSAIGDIRAYLSDRDNIEDSDRVGIRLDTFNNSRSAFEFHVNPRGIQMDRVIDEHTGNSDKSWDAIWYSNGKISSDGYVIELKIPFKALRFEDSDSSKIWGVEFRRVWPREVEYLFSNQIFDRNIGCELCQMSKVSGFEQAQSPTNLTLIPALTLIQSESRDINQQLGWQGGDVNSKASLDLRYGLTQNTYINATINPDFSQVEADALQLDINNLSSLFLNEKRAFFLDGSDYFNHWSRLVYTRIFQEPNYGIKLTGKQGEHSYGFIALEDKHTNFLIPYEYGTRLVKLENKASQNQVFRYRYDLGDTGNVGASITHRQSEGYENSMLAFDGKFWLSDKDFFKFQFMTSESDYPEEVLNRSDVTQENISDNAFSINYTHSARDWNGFATYHHFGEGFRADTGFVSFGNWTRKAFGGSRTWYAEYEDSWWKNFLIYSDWIHSEEIDGTDIDKGVRLNFEVNGIYESSFGIDLEDKTRTFIDQGLLFQPQTEYEVQYTTLWGEFRPVSNVGVSLEFSQGDEIDFSSGRPGDEELFVSELDFQLSTRLNVQIEYINQSLDVNDEELFEIDLTNLKLAYQINTKSFVRLTLQSQVLDRNDNEPRDKFLASQLIYSYKVNPFTLFYLGYSDEYLTQESTFDLEKSDKTIFMKFSYAWQL